MSKKEQALVNLCIVAMKRNQLYGRQAWSSENAAVQAAGERARGKASAYLALIDALRGDEYLIKSDAAGVIGGGK